MSSKNKLQILTLFSIITLSFSQNIISSWHYDKVQMYDIQKIGNALQTQLKEVKNLPEFTEDSIKISNLVITDVQISLYDSYLNFNTGLFLFNPNKITLSFNFSYTISGTTLEATFDLKINTLKMRLKNNKETQTQTVVSTMSSGEGDYSVFGISDKETSNKVKTVLYKGFENNKILNEKIASQINIVSYYEEFYKNKKPFTFKAGTLFDSKDVTVNLNRFVGFCEDVKGKTETALCYYSGELEEDKKDKSKVPLNNEDFVSSNETYNVFVNFDLFNSITAKLIKEGISDKIFKEGTSSKKLPYEFTVAFLKQVFSGIPSEFKDTDKFETKIHFNEITSNKASFSVSFKIADKDDVFSVDVETEIRMNAFVLKTVRFNLCPNYASTKDVKVKSGSVTIIDSAKLKGAIDESLNDDKLPLCLSDAGVSLRDYFAVVSEVHTTEEGLYIKGEQLYQ